MRTLIVVAALCFVACGPAVTVEPTLTNVEAQVFAKSCNFAACHTGAGSNGLNLEGATHAKLVGVKAKGPGVTDRTLVVAGDATASYLYEKLSQAMPAAGQQMPNTGDALSAEKIELVRAWIAAGAKDD